MISIQKAAVDIDRWEELINAITSVYEQTIRSTAQYAIDLDPAETATFRKHLDVLAVQLSGARNPEEWRDVGASFRGELREYRDRARDQLSHLRSEIQAAAEAMQMFAESITITGSGHEQLIQNALSQLSSLAKVQPAGEFQQAIEIPISTLTESVEMMRRSHQMAIAQMRDEIRLLHKQVDIERRALYLDRATGVWNRQKMDAHILALIGQDHSFCVLLICVGNLKRLEQRYSRSLIAGALKAFLQRFSALLGENSVIGRWSEDHFAAIVEEDAETTTAILQEATGRLTGPYSVQENGISHSLTLQTLAGVVEQEANSSAIAFQEKLLQLVQALARA